MEESMELVAKKCGKQLDTYQRCILSTKDDPEKCEPYRVELARCSADAVPLIAKTKQVCKGQILAYDSCLANNLSQGEEALQKNCSGVLRELWKCTEHVKAELRREQAGDSVTSQAEKVLGAQNGS